MLKFRPYAQLAGVLKAAARARWSNATDGDGYLYRTCDGALLDRIADDSDIEAHPQQEVMTVDRNLNDRTRPK